MLVWLLNWRRSIVIVGFIALPLLLGNSSFVPETKLLWVGWWVQQQQLPKTTTWRTMKRRVKLPSWYLRLQVMSRLWRSTPKRECLLRLVCYLLALSAVGWVWLLRWVICVMMRDESTPLLQGNWGWAGGVTQSFSHYAGAVADFGSGRLRIRSGCQSSGQATVDPSLVR